MHFLTVLAISFAALASASPQEEVDRLPTLSECCCCNGTPALGCSADLDCSPITPGKCRFTKCPF